MKYAILFFVLLFTTVANAQVQRVYYNSNHRLLSSKGGAEYCRTYTTQGNGTYKVEERHLHSDVLSFTGYYTSIDSESRSGFFLIYNDAGDKTSEGNYVNNKKDGEWKNYRAGKANELWYKAAFKNGLMNGPLTSYYKAVR